MKKPRRPIPITPIEPDFLEPDPEEETLQSIVGQFGPGDVQIKVYKQQQGGREYCSYFTNPADVNEESVRALGYGSGKYILHVMINGEFRKSIPMALAQNDGGVAIHAKDDPMTKILLERLSSLEQRLQQPEREPINQIADAMVKLNQLQAVNSAPRELPLDTILKCIELGKGLGGNDSNGDVLLEIVRQVAPALGPALGQMVLRKNGGAPMGQAKQLGPESSLNDVQQQLQERLKQGIQFLKRKCLANSDPGLYIDLIIDNRDEQTYQILIRSVLTQEFSAFTAVDPEIREKPFEPFFRQIYDGLRSAFAPVNPVDADTGRAGGDASNPASDGKPSKAGRSK